MSFSEQLKSFDCSALKPTKTIVRPLPVCCTGTEEVGLSALGGEVEEERHEDDNVTAAAASRCAEALRHAQYAVVYTGAGVSTSTGISDYRGPDGVWTSLATGRIPDDSVDVTAAVPSFTHMCIVKLVQAGFVKFCTSTNLDGLHLKSGLVPHRNLAELHGNMFYERCNQCGAEAVRGFPIRRTKTRKTGRTCKCGGDFTDSGIDFGQMLPLQHLSRAEQEAKKSDFSLVVGTSMRVRPASEIPLYSSRVAPDGVDGTKLAQLCIVNRMDTPFDARSSIRSYGKVDVFFHLLMKALEITPDLPPDCSNLVSGTQMKNLASKFLPLTNGHYVGEEERERRASAALAQAEQELLESFTSCQLQLTTAYVGYR